MIIDKTSGKSQRQYAKGVSAIEEATVGTVLNIQFFNLHDGDGVRTLAFLKGCPLKCRWCSNPESINSGYELGLNRTLCNQCGKCLEICEENALFYDDVGILQVDRERCNVCGKCIPACFTDALTVYGKQMSAQEVFEELRRDEIFYQGTGGGVTISGGEPLNQPKFLGTILKLCQEAGIHTCFETSGFARPEVLAAVLPFVDHILFDLKHMDSAVHKELTGQENEIILNNARTVADSGIPVLFRIPLIPGLNDSQENIRQTAQFIAGLGKESVQGVELMPYHRMGTGKYEALDKLYIMDGVKPPDPANVESSRKQIEDLGLKCTISK